MQIVYDQLMVQQSAKDTCSSYAPAPTKMMLHATGHRFADMLIASCHPVCVCIHALPSRSIMLISPGYKQYAWP